MIVREPFRNGKELRTVYNESGHIERVVLYDLKSPLSEKEKTIHEKATSDKENLIKEYWSKNEPFFYSENEIVLELRAKENNDNYFIKANPDGSEDLILLDYKKDEIIFVKIINQPGYGKFSYLLNNP